MPGNVAPLTSDDALSDVRRILEDFLGPTTAGSILFEALSASPGSIPSSPETVAAFVRGPCAQLLRDRFSEEEARPILDALRSAAGESPSPPEPEPEPEHDASPEAELVVSESDWPSVEVAPVRSRPMQSTPTFRPPPMAAPAGADPDKRDGLRVLVVARGKRLSFRVVAAFGGHRVIVERCHDLDDVRTKLAELDPALVIVDGEDAADMAPADLATELSIDDRLFTVVWGSDRFWGSALSAALERHGAHFTPLPLSTDTAPLFDFVRSRLPAD